MLGTQALLITTQKMLMWIHWWHTFISSHQQTQCPFPHTTLTPISMWDLYRTLALHISSGSFSMYLHSGIGHHFISFWEPTKSLRLKSLYFLNRSPGISFNRTSWQIPCAHMTNLYDKLWKNYATYIRDHHETDTWWTPYLLPSSLVDLKLKVSANDDNNQHNAQ